MKNSCRTSPFQEYRILEYAGMHGAVLSVHCPRPRFGNEISFFNLFPSPSLFFTLDIFETPPDYRIAMSEFLLSRISITVSAFVRVLRKIAVPLRRFFRKVVRLRTVYLFHCILRL